MDSARKRFGKHFDEALKDNLKGDYMKSEVAIDPYRTPEKMGSSIWEKVIRSLSPRKQKEMVIARNESS